MNFLLTIKIGYFSFFTYVKISWSPWHIKGEFNTFFSSFFSSTFPDIRMPKSVHVWPQLDNEDSTLFPKLHRIERACEFLLLIYHRSTKQTEFRLKPRWSVKRKKTTTCKKWLLGGVLQNSFPKNFTKSTEKIPVLETLSNTVKSVQATRLAFFLKERPPTLVFQNQPFVDPLQNRCSWIIHKIHEKISVSESPFN